MRVVRACVDELVGVLEIRLEEQGGTGEVERAMYGASCGPEVWAAPEHVFVWCGVRRMERGERYPPAAGNRLPQAL
jgi:hypothetical protein